MGQQYQVYVKIITDAFRPQNFPVGYVWQVDSVTAKYVVANGDAEHCAANGDPFVPTWTPVIQGTIVNGATLSIDYDIEMLVDTNLGLSVTVDGVDAPITALSVTASGTTISMTLDTPVTAGQVVTVTYDAGIGSIRSNATGTIDAKSFNDLSVSNVTA